MSNFFRVLFVGVVLTISGCAAPTQLQLANADYGSYPQNYEDTIKAYLNSYLKDPGSAQYRKLKGPSKAWESYFGPVQYGYAVCYAINAKNSYGGYTGEKTHYFMINNGVVTKHIYGKGGRYDLGEMAAQKGCAKLVS